MDQMTEEEVQKALDEVVELGDLEEVAPGRYRTTAQGRRNVEDMILSAKLLREAMGESKGGDG